MHCLALVTDAFGGRGGIAQYNRDLLAALTQTSVVSSIALLPRKRPALGGRLAYCLAALAAAVRHRPDIVFCGHLYMAPLAWLLARLRGAKLVVQTHGIEAWPRPSRLRRAAVEAADLVLCVSRQTRTCVAGWAAIAPERILVVPNTVAEAFTPGDGSCWRATSGLDGKKVLLTVGRIASRERYKGHDRVIAAIPGLVARGHDVAYLVVGDGDDVPWLKGHARKAGVTERVRFLGEVTLRDLVAAYRMADLFVMPSTGEGFGIVYLEAMASGTPALGLNVAGACDALADGELGVLAPEDELLAVIDHLLVAPRPDPEVLSRKVRARFGHPAFGAQLRMAFDRLLQPV
jgi:phosphatidylinositol alpha-1,6-mannosyltransferase